MEQTLQFIKVRILLSLGNLILRKIGLGYSTDQKQLKPLQVYSGLHPFIQQMTSDLLAQHSSESYAVMDR